MIIREILREGDKDQESEDQEEELPDEEEE